MHSAEDSILNFYQLLLKFVSKLHCNKEVIKFTKDSLTVTIIRAEGGCGTLFPCGKSCLHARSARNNGNNRYLIHKKRIKMDLMFLF